MQSSKDRILDAAIELFSEKGYSETSLRDIAALVGFKPSSIYNHFPSKSALFAAIVNEYYEFSANKTLSIDDMDINENVDARTLLSHIIFEFEPENALRYSKILKIILHEQFREPSAMQYIKNNMLADYYTYHKEILDALAAANKIKPARTDIYAKLLTALGYTAASEAMFYGVEEYRAMERVTRREAVAFLIDQLTLDDPE